MSNEPQVVRTSGNREREALLLGMEHGVAVLKDT